MANTIDNMSSHGVSWFKFDEASGNATDSKGSAVGTVTGATRTIGWNGDGSALNFDGVNDYVRFSSKVIPIGGKSIRFKIKTSHLPPERAIIMSNSNSSNTNGILARVNSDGSLAFIYTGEGRMLFSVASTIAITDNQWHDILFTWDGTTDPNSVKVYIDDMTTPNIAGKSDAIETSEPTYNFLIGANNKGSDVPNTYYFNGQLDELEIYNKVISPIPDKTLILNNNQYKYYTTSWDTIGATVDESDYIVYGMNDTSVIPESAWSELNGNVELCLWSDYQPKEEVEFQIETEPFSFYDEMGDSFDVLYYTDDPARTMAELEINANYSPLDELDGDFEVVTWTNELVEEDTELEKALEMSALPLGQLILNNADIELYGSIAQAISTRLDDDKRKGTIKVIVSFDGDNWKSYKDSKWVDVNVVNLDAVVTSGLTLSELENIPQKEFDVFKQSGTIRFGYYIEENIRDTDSAKIDKTELKQEATFDSPEINDMSLYVLNTISTIKLTLTGRDLAGRISDIDFGKVRYRVFLNGEPYLPHDGNFTDFQATPLDIAITLDGRAIKMGEENTLQVEFEDYWGSKDAWNTTFIGQYYGLIFEDPQSNAYATDIGQVLKYLDVGTLIAGQKSTEFLINLHNTHGYDVENPTITSYTEYSNVDIELSKTSSPFVAEESIRFEQVLGDGESIPFYMRIATKLTTPPVMGGIFELRVNADKV